MRDPTGVCDILSPDVYIDPPACAAVIIFCFPAAVMALLRVSSYRKLFEEEQWSQAAGRCGVQARSAARSVLLDLKALHIFLVHFK